jgi:hypothetical protein
MADTPTNTQASPAPSEATSSPSTSTTSQSNTPTTSSAAPSKTSSFIESALGAIKSELSGNTPSDASDAPVQEAATTKSSEPTQTTDSKTQAAVQDEEDSRAEADIKRETSSMSAAHRAAFTKLRYEARDLKRQLKAAAEAKEAAATPAQNAEASADIERLRTEYDAMKARVAEFEQDAYVTRLESTEKYKTEVAQPRDQVAQAVGEISKRYEAIDPESIIMAVRSGDAERVSRVTADMSEFDRYRFYNLVDQFHGINGREEAMRANAKETIESSYRAQREREEAKASEEKEAWSKSLDSVWSQLEEEFPVLAPVDGDEDWNSKVSAVKNFATPDRFSALTVKERAETLYRAAAFPVLVAELESAVEEMKSAQEKLSRYESATPGVQSSGSEAEGFDGGSSFSSGSFMDNALTALRKAGSR